MFHYEISAAILGIAYQSLIFILRYRVKTVGENKASGL